MAYYDLGVTVRTGVRVGIGVLVGIGVRVGGFVRVGKIGNPGVLGGAAAETMICTAVPLSPAPMTRVKSWLPCW